ncbi:RluA family pseudouridine synthase [Paenibacillus apiarius]|uniref:RNA pseudouridylate synthase n=1 Tax=Paenibacillus apiarius TaxID=46240 RepID=A0ABT4DXH0_9BACL|nr:RluA family pseudouridine synthase [Paenibacillus apiarius]MCY9515858.1 RluA family pseudouridine synthase [Paenibacillus apiarius]MCY9520768.1 RluA family pseudouridine synthase [Paenibacillus apiarius]MCY9553472.1 RluA family pseudouridine synthase [Paenibacillus apiarius]MCY9558004.1 RluA family pseudouridine synthase [Paenibacillus apiarius]MCY9685859.1 RluA family pseudouridine synthase [Paenibacillus apiarius]
MSTPMTQGHIPILFEDNHVLVVEKPVNILSQADDSNDVDMLTLLKHDLKIRYEKPGNVFLGLVHRLDRPVGGAMVFAKTSKAASRLSDVVRRHDLGKMYMAVVHGCPRELQGDLTHHLYKDARTNIVRTVPAGTAGAKEARLSYEVIGSSQDLSLIRVRLHTGRPHQIRVQMQTIGCPLYGDQKYGAKWNRPGQQIALWSVLLSFPHPTTKEHMEFRSIPPREFPWNQWDVAAMV